MHIDEPHVFIDLTYDGIDGALCAWPDRYRCHVGGRQDLRPAIRIDGRARHRGGLLRRGPADLPARLVIKIAHGVDSVMAPLYENEVSFYNRIRPELDLETPRSFGAGFDAETSDFAIVLEDLAQRGASFSNVLMPVSLDNVRSLLSQQAKLHARFWQSPRRGHHMHDVSYLVTTALSIDDRRTHEEDLLRYYLECLKVEGVADVPSSKTASPNSADA